MRAVVDTLTLLTLLALHRVGLVALTPPPPAPRPHTSVRNRVEFHHQ